MNFSKAFLLVVLSVLASSSWTSADDAYRPAFHFLPEHNWMNDPNGPMYYNGYYHLFFQYNPSAAVWGNMHWGHAISKDLVYWQHLPVALSPGSSCDPDGCFSGSATILKNGTPVLAYTGVNPELQCLAFPANLSDPTLTNWTKYSGNPIMSTPPTGVPQGDWRDDTTGWQINGTWYMLNGASVNGSGGALLWKSSDFLSWSFVHTLYSSDAYDTMWECPDFFPLPSTASHPDDAQSPHLRSQQPPHHRSQRNVISNPYVLKGSSERRDWWVVGDFDETTLKFAPVNPSEPGSNALMDYGHYYASKSFHDTKHNRRIVFGWSSEQDTQGPARDWQGVQSLPREILSSEDGLQLLFAPIKELMSLRQKQTQIPSLLMHPGQYVWMELRGLQMEIQIDFHFEESVSDFAMFGVDVLAAPNLFETTKSYMQWTNGTYAVDFDRPGSDYKLFYINDTNPLQCQSACAADSRCVAWTYVRPGIQGDNARCCLKDSVPEATPSSCCVSGAKAAGEVSAWASNNLYMSSLKNDTDRQVQTGPLRPDASQTHFSLHVFVDHSIVESYFDGGKAAITSRVYPTLDDSQHVRIFNGGNVDVTIDSGYGWTLESIW